ncbi:hypothetical protein FRC14_004745 [Serendipita sp. 396]|nr:hypothetical protein FRC14_004745 [Serendipita sp. 396]
MANLIFYDNFQAAPNLFTADGGPWSAYESSTDVNLAIGGSYTVSIYTNIVLDPSRYGNVSSLEFIWQYLPWWGTSTDGAISSVRLWTSTVGNNTYDDTLKAGGWSESVWNGKEILLPFASTPHSDEYWGKFILIIPTILGTPFLHTGHIPLPSSAADYIPLSINITFPCQFADTVGLWVKDVGFLITTPTVTSVASVTAGGITSLYTPNPSNDPEPATVSPSKSSKNTGAIAGGVIGAIALIVICLVVGFTWGRNKNKRRTSNVVVPTGNSAPAPIPIDGGMKIYGGGHSYPVTKPVRPPGV